MTTAPTNLVYLYTTSPKKSAIITHSVHAAVYTLLQSQYQYKYQQRYLCTILVQVHVSKHKNRKNRRMHAPLGSVGELNAIGWVQKEAQKVEAKEKPPSSKSTRRKAVICHSMAPSWQMPPSASWQMPPSSSRQIPPSPSRQMAPSASRKKHSANQRSSAASASSHAADIRYIFLYYTHVDT